MNTNHATLSERGLDLIIQAAQRGWSPKDLLHVVGDFCHPLIYRAAGQVPAQISSTASVSYTHLTLPTTPYV